MTCERCDYCQYPRTSDDNNGLCKCKLMQRKTIDVYVGGGETPDWCPIKKATPEEVLHEISTRVFRNTDDCEMKISKKCYKGIVDAVDRLITKPVSVQTEHSREFIDYCCPNCNVTLQQSRKCSSWRQTIYRYKHCHECGQSLDWNNVQSTLDKIIKEK